MVKPLSFALLSVCLCACLSGARAQRKQLGYVRHVEGLWTLQGSAVPVKLWQPIYVGDVPFVAGRMTQGSLTIGLLSSATPWEWTCTRAIPCEGPYMLKVKPPSSGPIDYLRSYFGPGSKPTPAVFAGARDAEAGPLHAVLPVTGTSVLLAGTLAHFAPGRYRLRFTPLAPSHGAPAEFPVDWAADSPVLTPAPAPGFYALDAFLPNGDLVGSHAAVLLVPAADTATQQHWQQALTAITNAAGSDAELAARLRLAAVLSLRDGEAP